MVGEHIDAGALHALVAGELSPSRQRLLDDHLKSCAVCRADLLLARSFVSVGANADLGERSTELRAAFARRLEAARGGGTATVGTRRRWSRPVANLLIAASVVIVVVGIRQLVPRRGAPSAPTPAVRGTSDDLPVSLTPVAGGWRLSWTIPASWQAGAPDSATVQIVGRSGRVVREMRTAGEGIVILRAGLPVDGNEPWLVRVAVRSDDGTVLESALRALTKP